MAKLARSDDSFARLHAAGWTVGDVAVHGESAPAKDRRGSFGAMRVA
jgi:hypothetical protein